MMLFLSLNHLVAQKTKFDSLISAFDPFDTEYKRFKYLSESGCLQKTIEYAIGTKLEIKIVIGLPQISVTESKGTFVSLQDTLKSFFSIPGVFSETVLYIDSLERSDDHLSNLMQGLHWTSIENHYENHYENKLVMPLLVYFDEFETCNPVGPSAGIHKQGAVYASLPCLPQHVSSRLENIFLCLLFHASDSFMQQ